MDSPFIYDKYVTGKNFIGRKADCNILSNLLGAGENVSIYEAPRSGKRSVIQQTLFNMRVAGKPFIIGEFNVFNIRCISDFLIRLVTTAIRTTSTTQDEYKRIIETHLDGTSFEFDQKHFSETGEIVVLRGEPTVNDIHAATRLPYLLSAEKSTPIIIIINEFQNVDLTEDGDKVYKAMEEVLKEMQKTPMPKASYLFSGSEVNAMKSIFEGRKYFYRQVEHFQLRPIETKEFGDHITRSFLSGGKVLDRDLLAGVCKLFRNHPGYINQFVSLCDYMSKGFITEPVLLDALDTIIAINEPRFKAIMNDMTTYQVSLLKAVLDGYSKFSASEVITKYGLNSSANVKRLKEALMKKEVITFDENDIPQIIDPLFEHWVSKYYFGMKREL
ncbi:MAG: hypothetical protein MJZ16_08445 [Bacteroidales bacterium]|nr:hypothetical protein [Bacteroidales bacterium]